MRRFQDFHWLQEEALLMWNGLVRKKIQMDMAGLQVKDMVLILKNGEESANILKK